VVLGLNGEVMGLTNTIIANSGVCSSCGYVGRVELQFRYGLDVELQHKYGCSRPGGPFQIGDEVEADDDFPDPPFNAVVEATGMCPGCSQCVTGDVYFENWKIASIDTPGRFHWGGLEPLERGREPSEDEECDLTQYPSERLWPRRDLESGLPPYEWQWQRANAILKAEDSTAADQREANRELEWIECRAAAHLDRMLSDRTRLSPWGFEQSLRILSQEFGRTASGKEAVEMLKKLESDLRFLLDWIGWKIKVDGAEIPGRVLERRGGAELIAKIRRVRANYEEHGPLEFVARIDRILEHLSGRTQA